jgi:hypothetical protein
MAVAAIRLVENGRDKPRERAGDKFGRAIHARCESSTQALVDM